MKETTPLTDREEQFYDEGYRNGFFDAFFGMVVIVILGIAAAVLIVNNL